MAEWKTALLSAQIFQPFPARIDKVVWKCVPTGSCMHYIIFTCIFQYISIAGLTVNIRNIMGIMSVIIRKRLDLYEIVSLVIFAVHMHIRVISSATRISSFSLQLNYWSCASSPVILQATPTMSSTRSDGQQSVIYQPFIARQQPLSTHIDVNAP